jgi:hypothetical protein
MQDNIIIRTFHHGGPVMWPLLLTAVIAVAVFIERVWWWVRKARRTDVRRFEQVLVQTEGGPHLRHVPTIAKTELAMSLLCLAYPHSLLPISCSW